MCPELNKNKPQEYNLSRLLRTRLGIAGVIGLVAIMGGLGYVTYATTQLPIIKAPGPEPLVPYDPDNSPFRSSDHSWVISRPSSSVIKLEGRNLDEGVRYLEDIQRCSIEGGLENLLANYGKGGIRTNALYFRSDNSEDCLPSVPLYGKRMFFAPEDWSKE